ncbi:MAG: M14 family metallopeptidase [Vicinamibacterales bacterium]
MPTSLRLARCAWWEVPGLAVLAVLAAVALPGAAIAQQRPSPATRPAQTGDWPLTRPEATNYAETSRYDEVIAFMKAMAAANPAIHLATYGYTSEGRPLPLAVIGAAGATPQQVRAAAGKTRIYIQGNIHAGEVEGKEACLWLLRSIAKGERARWFDNVVLLVNPIYNADGNERVNVRNRGSQNGPVGGMGQRANAQDLDLNRDNTKLETPEARSVARLMTDYDPHIAIDLHTTNGSNHGFYLTYETSLSPNTSPGITKLVRGQLLPAVTKAVKDKHGWSYFYYGGVARQGERAWRGDPELYKPRYTQTYFGIRNRIGILSETYSYASFEDRIKSNYWFLEEIVNFAAANGEAIRRVTAEADRESIIGVPQAVRVELVKLPDPVEIVLADVVEERNPYVPDRPMRRRVNGSEKTEVMPHYGLVQATETSVAPRAFVVPALPSPPAGAATDARAGGLPVAGTGQTGGRGQGAEPTQVPPPGRGGMPPGSTGQPAGGQGRMGGPGMGPGSGGGAPVARMIASVADRLEAHGIAYFRTSADRPFNGERFRIQSSTLEAREYQGTHRLRALTGTWEALHDTLPAGSIVVPMDQPLARLAFVLFDPRSDDGFMAWNILDPVLGATPAPEFYPVWRTMEAVAK